MRDDLLEQVQVAAMALERREALLAKLPKAISCGDLMRKSFPPKAWTWEGCLPRGELAVLSGPKGSGKTLLGLDLCISSAMGLPLLGIPTVKTKAVYLSLELGEGIMQNRIKKMELNWPEDQLSFYWKWPKLPEGAPALQTIIENDKIGLFVIDVFAKLRPLGADWNDYGKCYDQVGPLREIAQSTGATILLLTHDRKGETDDPSERILGSVGLAGNSGVILSLTTRLNQKTGVLEISGNDVEYRIIPIILQTDPLRFMRSNETSEEATQTVERRAVLAVIRELGGTAKTGQIAKKYGKADSTVSEILKKLKELGLISSARFGEYNLPNTTESTETPESEQHPESSTFGTSGTFGSSSSEGETELDIF